MTPGKGEKHKLKRKKKKAMYITFYLHIRLFCQSLRRYIPDFFQTCMTNPWRLMNIYHTICTVGPTATLNRYTSISTVGPTEPIHLPQHLLESFSEREYDADLSWGQYFISIDGDTGIGSTSCQKQLVGVKAEATYRTYFLGHEGGVISYAP